MPITQEQHLITNIKNHLNTIDKKQAFKVRNIFDDNSPRINPKIGDQIAIINDALDEIGRNLK